MSSRPLVLVIIDGFGHSENKIGNAIALAQKPFLDHLRGHYPFTLLQASGQAVGLDWGESGNSEVGHLSIGAGRIVKQYLSIINDAINSGEFFVNPALARSMKRAVSSSAKLHLLGLLTSGSVHASFKHLLALLEMARKFKIPAAYLHLFMDGKDSAPKEGLALLKKLRENLPDSSSVKIATIVGRNYAMERNNDWTRTAAAYGLFAKGLGQVVDNLENKIQAYYDTGLTDDNLPPTIVNGLPSPLITASDSLIFFNFREDSMRQITRAFVDREFPYFTRESVSGLHVTTLTKYFDCLEENFAFPPLQVLNNLAQWLGLNGKKQFHMAESEKYAHVTLFFNGLEDKIYDGETDFFLESPHDLAAVPEMRSADIAEKVVNELRRDYYDFFLINFANADLIAHLGNINLVAKGIEKVDTATRVIYQEVKKQNGLMIITSDHGNAEALTRTVTGERETKHNISPVPFYLVSEDYLNRTFSGKTSGILADIAPTVLELMALPVPKEMTGQSLLSHLE